MGIGLSKSQIALGWVDVISDERAKQLEVADGSYAVFYRDSGRIRVEILSPPSLGLVKSSVETSQKFKEAFEEMKRLGD